VRVSRIPAITRSLLAIHDCRWTTSPSLTIRSARYGSEVAALQRAPNGSRTPRCQLQVFTYPPNSSSRRAHLSSPPALQTNGIIANCYDHTAFITWRERLPRRKGRPRRIGSQTETKTVARNFLGFP